MKTQHTHPYKTVWTLCLFGTVALLLGACNLGVARDTAPPTIVPRASATPIATLGFSGSTGETDAGIVAPSNITTPIVDPAREVTSLLNQVEVDRLLSHVETLQNMFTRHVNSTQSSDTQGVGAAVRYMENQFKVLQQTSGGRLYTFSQEFDLTWNGISTKQYNVVAVIQGIEAGAGTVVVGAHYDSVGGGDINNASVYAPGANDNASGVAAVLELARILSTRQHRSSIMLVLFGAEEVGRRGSRAFAQYLVNQKVDVIGMVNIDTIGNANDRRGNIIDNELRLFSDGPNETSISRHMARTAEFISFTHGIEMKLTVQDAIDRENRYGDHFSFSEVGYPAIRFINALEEKANADSTDTIEFIEPSYLRKSTQAILLVVAAMAEGPRPPRNVSLRDKGDGTSTLVWEPVPDATGYIIALRFPNSLRYDQQIEWTGNSIDWDGFKRYAGIAIAAKGATGIVGPLSQEYKVR